MTMVSVKPVTDAGSMEDFLSVAYRVYRDDPQWVAPIASELRRTLDFDRNPYFATAVIRLFIAYRDTMPVARCCVVVNREQWRRSGVNQAFFGCFEALDDDEAVDRLFGRAREFARSAGATVLEGPFNPHHYAEVGLQTDAFDQPPIFFEAYNPPYYCSLVERAGFRVRHRIHTRINRDPAGYLRKRYGDADHGTRRGEFTVRNFSLLRFGAELERIREINNEAFNDNWYFLPLSRAEYRFSTASLFLVTYPRLIMLVEHRGRPVGVLQCVLDVNPLLRPMRGRPGPGDYLRFIAGRRRIRDLVIYAVGIKKAYRHTRVYILLLDLMRRVARKYRTVSSTWMYDENRPAKAAAESLGLEPYKWFAIYAQRL